MTNIEVALTNIEEIVVRNIVNIEKTTGLKENFKVAKHCGAF